MNYSLARLGNKIAPGRMPKSVKKVGIWALVVLGVILLKPLILKLWDEFKRLFESKEIKAKRSWLEEQAALIDWNSISSTPAELELAAAQLYDCFEHSGTDWDRVWEIIHQRNRNDLLAILVFYDIKTTHIFFFDDVTGTLYDHYRSELSDSQLADVVWKYGEDINLTI